MALLTDLLDSKLQLRSVFSDNRVLLRSLWDRAEGLASLCLHSLGMYKGVSFSTIVFLDLLGLTMRSTILPSDVTSGTRPALDSLPLWAAFGCVRLAVPEMKVMISHDTT